MPPATKAALPEGGGGLPSGACTSRCSPAGCGGSRQAHSRPSTVTDLLSPHEGVFPVHSKPAVWLESARAWPQQAKYWGQGGDNTSKLQALSSRLKDRLSTRPLLHSLNGVDQKVPALAGQCDYPSHPTLPHNPTLHPGPQQPPPHLSAD